MLSSAKHLLSDCRHLDWMPLVTELDKAFKSSPHKPARCECCNA